jgi:alpha-N-arabinofuranosidase
MKNRSQVLSLIASLVLPLTLGAQSPSLTVQADKPTAKVSPMLYGLMTEEINYSYDGGLYAELVRDRTIGREWDALGHWALVARGSSAAKVSVDESNGPSAALKRSLKVSVTLATEAAPAGVENDGYWGIPVRPRTTYSGSLYAKTDSAGVPVTVSLVNDQTGVVAASATVDGLTGDWKQYTFALKTGDVPVTANESPDSDDSSGRDGLV